MDILCLKCKGRGFCGRVYCPIYAKANSMMRMKKALSFDAKEEFSSKAPAVLVGRSGYPSINIGIMAPPEIPSLLEHAELYDAPRVWGKDNFGVDRIIELRSSLINSKFRADVKKVRSVSKDKRMLELAQEISMAARPVDIDIRVEDAPRFRLNLSPDIAPFGPDARLKNATLTENPKISPLVEKTVSDYDFKANDAISTLFSRGFDENAITKLLSTGTLGVKMERKLVPTRWAITAVDDSLGKERIAEIKDYKNADCLAFFSGYLGNYYLVLMFPEPWSYELFETYMPRAEWNQTDNVQFMTDYESYSGRKRYAENCAGGYYAARLPILDRLHQMKRQASLLVIRVITGEYFCPLGVWVVREATRKAMQSQPIEFADASLMLRYASSLLKKKFGLDASHIFRSSILLKNLREQKKIQDFYEN